MIMSLIFLAASVSSAAAADVEGADAEIAPSSTMMPQAIETMPSPVEHFVYTTSDGKTTITGYVGPGGDVTIPSEICDMPVTSIGFDAFYQCISLTSIVIPDSVTSIDSYAFSSCSSLISAHIGNGVTSIGQEAFSLCSELTSIIIPDGVTSIDRSTFSSCRSLTRVCIGSGVNSIDDTAFSGCRSLTSLTIPDGVTSIGYRAFYACSSLTSMQFKGDAPTRSGWGDLDPGLKVYYIDGATGFDSPSWGGIKRIAVVAPGTPSGLEATVGMGEASLTWAPPSNLGEQTVHEVWYGTSADSGTWALFDTVNALTATVTGLEHGTTYHFGVKAVNIAGASEPSTMFVTTPTIPDAPDVTAAAGDGRAILIWDAPNDRGAVILEYIIYQDDVEIARVTETTFVVNGLDNERTYTFRVAAKNAVGIGDRSESASATPLPAMVPIRGKIMDADGSGLAGVMVSLEDGTSAMTGDDGSFSIMASQGLHTLTISGDDIETTTKNVTVNGMELDLRPIPVTLLDDGDGDSAMLLAAAVGVVVAAMVVAIVALRLKK